MPEDLCLALNRVAVCVCLRQMCVRKDLCG